MFGQCLVSADMELQYFRGWLRGCAGILALMCPRVEAAPGDRHALSSKRGSCLCDSIFIMAGFLDFWSRGREEERKDSHSCAVCAVGLQRTGT